MDFGISYKTAHALRTHRFRIHFIAEERIKDTLKLNKHLVVPRPSRNLKSSGYRLAVDRMVRSQHIQTSTCHSSCYTDFSLSAWL